MKRRCPKCGATWEVNAPIGFREECPECAAFLHTCGNCHHYDPALKGCRLPNTEAVRDPHGVNFCEEFEYEADARRTGGPAAPPAAGPPVDDARRRIADLFRDPSS